MPTDRGGRQSRGDVDERHWSAARYDIVRQFWHANIEQETSEPTRMRDNLRKKPRFCKEAATEQLLHAIARVPLAHSGYRCVDGDNQSRETCGSCPLYRALGRHSPPPHVQMAEDRSGGTCFCVLQRRSTNR